MLDPVAVERAESKIDNFISKRAREREEANALEKRWAESERKDREKRRRRNQAEWYGFHEHMRGLHASLATEHEAKALALLEESGAPVQGEGAIVNG